ncbi:MAG: HIRAN domain-containing protein [Oscillospiraceae bacterium]
MSDNQIVISKETVVGLSANNGITEMIKPLMKEVFLLSTFVAGTTHVKNRSVFEEIKEGDKLILKREPDNRFDELAILVLAQSGKKLGYVPEKDNPVLARLMDAGKKLTAAIETISVKGKYYSISIDIMLVDF